MHTDTHTRLLPRHTHRRAHTNRHKSKAYLSQDSLSLGGIEIKNRDVGLVPHELDFRDEEAVRPVVQALVYCVVWVCVVHEEGGVLEKGERGVYAFQNL